MSIQIGLEQTVQSDICHSNNAILEMANGDFFIAKNIPTGLLNILGSSNCWKRLNTWEVTSEFLIRKIGGNI